ncbi:MAG TPA: hypothetical protein PKC28_01805 [Bdellovibrionales bacterium]|nr:hypothetical protein [Bdellovibrionales bacterium]
MIRVLLITSFLFSGWAHAQDAEDGGDAPKGAVSRYQVDLDTKEQRLLFGLYGQMSQFQRQGGALTGYNLEGIANYAIDQRYAAQLSLAQSLDLANGLTVLFTGLRVGMSYAVWGNFIERVQHLRVNNENTLYVRSPDRSMLVVDGGVDQYLFNGVERIVPATGASLGLRFDKTIWGVRGSIMGRYGALVISEDPVSMLTLGAGLLLHF